MASTSGASLSIFLSRLLWATVFCFICVAFMRAADTKDSPLSRPAANFTLCTDDMTTQQCFYAYLAVYAHTRINALQDSERGGPAGNQHSQLDSLGICSSAMSDEQCFYAYLAVYAQARAMARDLTRRIHMGPVRPQH